LDYYFYFKIKKVFLWVATPTVADRDLFYRQWGDQLNGERRGTEDLQPVITTNSCLLFLL
jgi:hypothetical protein